jgi:biotin operon repressor
VHPGNLSLRRLREGHAAVSGKNLGNVIDALKREGVEIESDGVRLVKKPRR